MKQRTRKSAWLLALLALVAVNIVAALAHARFDLTAEHRYSLSKPTQRLLRGIDSTVNIDVFLTGKDLPSFVRKFRSSLEDFLSETREYGGSKLEFRFVDPFAGDTASSRLLLDSLRANYGLTPVAVQAPEKVGDRLEVTSLIHGAVVRQGERAVGVDLLKGQRAFGTSAEELAALYNNVEASVEYKFASAIEKVTTKEKPLVAYLLGNGEAWGYNINDAFVSLRDNYFADTLNLKKVPFIPAEIDAVVVMKPTVPFSNDDKLKLDQYVTHGGKIFWMVDNMYAEFDSLYKSGGFISFDRGLNLEDLYFNWGVRLNTDLVQDMQSDQLPQVNESNGQQRLVNWPFFPVLDGTQHPISKNLDGVRAFFPTSMDTVEAAGVRKTVLLQSSANARVLGSPAKIDFSLLQVAPDEKLFRRKNVPVAYLLEGQFPSLYAGRLPRSVADSLKAQKYDFFPATTQPNKMIVVADGDLALNQFSASSGPLPMGMNPFTRYTYANKEFFLNSLEYLVNPSDILQTRSKEFTLRLLDPRRVKEQRSTWQAVTVALPVVLLVLFGALYQQARRRRYASSVS
ncbi:gliding motility-associated ABC transporter substrate-binding protein GldG [Flaviaesturariibacter aridisoli]|uniref:Gliding motility-associated ABC transporter substrate-binding protein GldG n=1 Tax=Flaviaesturariibacter aridisoli TaxID=2545761 RepID=A0A4R4E7J1_9BACT|nr:gliding motility-associated ABC transporter substrate-binding protein GldG [Flaviaesturariibacter aridisoli]TCZ74883.1 gliding motility-associated ABC transporter substrate-binding protein GldG [Flaviaesturariibacter aridisoli]